MRIKRNIDFFEDSLLPYQVRVIRHNQNISESYATYEEAIAARNEIEANFLETKELTHSSTYENGRYKNARSKYQSGEIKRTIDRYGEPHYSIETVCKQCNARHTYITHTHYKNFLNRGRRCCSCSMKFRAYELTKMRHASDKAYASNRSTGIKNINFIEDKEKYRVAIERNSNRAIRFTKTLNEALAIKEQILDFYEQFDRLPTRAEV